MTRRDVLEHTVWEGRQSANWCVGSTVAIHATIWRVQGLVLGVTASGTPELRWVLDEQTLEPTAGDTGGDGDDPRG